MPMEREEHENLLNELLNPELEQTRRVDILQILRVDYGGVITDDKNFKEQTQKLQADNADLVIANSKLFRQSGILGDDDMKKKVEEKEFSETVTLESFEK